MNNPEEHRYKGICKPGSPKGIVEDKVFGKDEWVEIACVPTGEEWCDGIDNDSDGLTDEDFPTKGPPCDGPDTDLCNEGQYVCKADGSNVECNDMTGDTKEVCDNGIDDDCDGETKTHKHAECITQIKMMMAMVSQKAACVCVRCQVVAFRDKEGTAMTLTAGCTLVGQCAGKMGIAMVWL